MFAIERRLETCALHGDLQRVPRVHLQRHVLASLLDETALAFYESPKHDVVFLAVEAHGEIVAVGLQVEEDARTLIELARHEFESHRDLAVVEIINILRNRIRE